ncbi:g11364 [Coccomyxa elongata]
MSSKNKAALVLYRAALKAARKIDAALGGLDVRLPLDTTAWQMAAHEWSSPTEEYRLDAVHQLLPGLPQPPKSGSFRKGELKHCIRSNFEASSAATPERLPELLDLGFDALRVLAEQYVLESCSAQATTNGVHVEITTACIGSKIPLDLIETPTARPVWTYRVRIENVGDRKVQLLGRQWLIRTSEGHQHAVVPRGSTGVVGCTPILKPGECFQYYSATDLSTPNGTMKGSFQMVELGAGNEPNMPFDATIPSVALRS